jgi:hypothetical protein
MKKQFRKNKQKSKLRLKNAKDTFCNNTTDQGDTYKKHTK